MCSPVICLTAEENLSSRLFESSVTINNLIWGLLHTNEVGTIAQYVMDEVGEEERVGCQVNLA